MRDCRSFPTIPPDRQPAPFRQVACAAFALLCVITGSAAYADDSNLKDGAKRAGHALGAVARDVGQGAKKVGKAVGDAAKEGGREFRQAVKGESR
jgi:hypothetical protein